MAIGTPTDTQALSSVQYSLKIKYRLHRKLECITSTTRGAPVPVPSAAASCRRCDGGWWWPSAGPAPTSVGPAMRRQYTPLRSIGTRAAAVGTPHVPNKLAASRLPSPPPPFPSPTIGPIVTVPTHLPANYNRTRFGLGREQSTQAVAPQGRKTRTRPRSSTP